MKKVLLTLILTILISLPAFSQQQETLTLTTYYPSPFGVYRNLLVTESMAIGNVDGSPGGEVDVDDLPVDQEGNPLLGSLSLSGYVGIGTVAPVVALDVRTDSGPSCPSPVYGPVINMMSSRYGDNNTYSGITFHTDLTGDERQYGIYAGAGCPNANSNFRFVEFLDSNDIVDRITIVGGTGDVGIGQENPQAKLDVAGDINATERITTAKGVKLAGEGADTDITCTEEGLMRYNSTDKQMQYCDGTDWKSTFASAGGGPTFINPVVARTNAPNNTWITYDASASIPAGATAVILEVGVTSGSDVRRKEAYFRRDSTQPTHVTILSTTFHLTTQVVCPVTANRTFQYHFKNTGGWQGNPANKIRLIGYY